MSLREVSDDRLVVGVTRLRHVELGTVMIYMGADAGSVWVRDADGVDPASYGCHIDDAELIR